MNVIITGGSGFIGSSLAESLMIKEHQVTLLIRSDDKSSNIKHFEDKINIEKCDVTDIESTKKIITGISPDTIFHFAGQLTHYESFENPWYDIDVNSKSTITILETIRNLKNNCRFILGSTFWVVGKPTRLPVNEEDCCIPKNIYAADRLASENYCSIYNNIYGLDTIVARFTNTYGPKEQYLNPKKAALNYLLYKAFKGEEIPIYNEGKFYKDYIYVSDVVSACNQILQKGNSGETYFVGTGKKTWFYEFVDIIKELTDCKIKYIDAPSYHKKVDVGNFVIDNKKICSLGWEPKIEFKEGIKNILEYFKKIEE